jgi:sulfate adenylyltransferase large subunit
MMKIVIVGHVDHGKSTLIGRLLYDTGSISEAKLEEIKSTCKALGRDLEFAYVMDHLQEERERNITIDTSQIFFSSPNRRYVIIDAPGHKTFIKNMITGASQADAAILIVDAEQGVQEQTKRHAYILNMLGLKQVIVVLNKMDKINYDKDRFAIVKNNVLEFLNKINITPVNVIPISAKHGDNIVRKAIDWYDGKTVIKALDNLEDRIEQVKPLRFPVQDVYDLDGRRIIAGRVESGELSAGQFVKVNGQEFKINNIEKYQEQKQKAMAGESVGIVTDVNLKRGDIIYSGNMPVIRDMFNANIFWLSQQPVVKGEQVVFKCATQEILCVIEQIKKRIDSSSLEVIEENAEHLEETEVGEVIIKTEKPVVFDKFSDIPAMGRFVLEKKDTVAGGIIVGD